MTEQEKYSRLILANTQGVGPSFFKKVLNDYQSINSFLQDNSSTLYKKIKHKLGIAKSVCSEIDTNSFVVYGEANYPINLLNIADAPLVLFYKGRIEIINQRRNIAVVGTRNCTSYGERITSMVSDLLVNNSINIISGLALGIDVIAHQSILPKYADCCVAVLGTSVSNPTPRSNIKTYNSIIDNGGVVVSEFYNQETYDKYIFPRRNRIIAGIADDAIVVEAPIKSGALITARLAFDYSRTVYSFPNSIFSKNSGTNYLISENISQAVESIEKLASYLKITATNSTNSQDSITNSILVQLQENDLSFEQLAESVNIAKSNLTNYLLKLEINGIISRSLTGYYRIK